MNERIRAVKKSVRSEKAEERRRRTRRRRGEGIKDERLCREREKERERESDGAVGGDCRLEQQHSSYTSPILYLAQSFHYSLSTLLNRVYRHRLGKKKSGKNKGDRTHRDGREREGRKKRKKESIRTRERERGAELFCSVAMETHRPELQRADSCHGTAGCHG